MPLFNVYCGSGQTFGLIDRVYAKYAGWALLGFVGPDHWNSEIALALDGEIVRDKSGKEWFAVRVN